MAFTTMQLIGSLVVTVCVALLMIAAFRPGASGCCNTPGLGFAGGYLMVLYAVCQIFAFALVIAIAKRQDDYGKKHNTYGAYFRMRPTGLATPDPDPTEHYTIGNPHHRWRPSQE